jgi:hypothetical protein
MVAAGAVGDALSRAGARGSSPRSSPGEIFGILRKREGLGGVQGYSLGEIYDHIRSARCCPYLLPVSVV